MKRLMSLAVMGVLAVTARAVQPWQDVVTPTVAEAAKGFAQPPNEYRAIYWTIWGGQQTKERVLADIEHVAANGAGVYMINNSRGLSPKYFTPEYLDLVKFAVMECKKRGLKVWIEGDAGYPDGFAGGMISEKFPQLAMQGVVADARVTVNAGAMLKMALPVDTLGIVARRAGAPTDAPEKELPLPADGTFKWTAPSGAGTSEVTFVGSVGELRVSAVPGQVVTMPVPAGTTAIRVGTRAAAARGAAAGAETIALPADGTLNWTAPAGGGAWEVTFVRHVFRSSPTRYTNRADGTADKDALYAVIDYLNPEATKAYMSLIHEEYEKRMGDEFGKTIMGFRNDEPDYTGFMPWTPKLLATFEKEKGYDLRPYFAQFFMGEMTAEAWRAKADYWDVWSAMFRDNFYKPQEEWCRARNMEYMVHLNHEEVMVSGARGGVGANGESMVTNEGSFWRCMRFTGVPGIDNLNQIGPGIVADFPKLAGSAAHVYGRPQVWTESGGGLGQAGKFVADYQLVRGINYLNMRGVNAAPPAPAGDAKPLVAPAVATAGYVSRASYLLSMGRPGAHVALYHPTDSMWMGDTESDAVTVKLVTELMERQIDFDHIDADGVATDCKLEGGGLKNLSGQVYDAVIVPSSTVIQKKVLERLKAFAGGGGKVIFVGRTPTLVAGASFLKAEAAAPDLSFATLEPAAEITEKVVAAIPTREVKLEGAPAPMVKYLHRVWKDGDVYFFFNEGAEAVVRTAVLERNGKEGVAQVWDATTGAIRPLGAKAGGSGAVSVSLTLAPHESQFVIIGAVPAGAGPMWPVLATSKEMVAVEGNWSVTLNGKQLETPLKSWQDLGEYTFAGVGEYRKTFELKNVAGAATSRVYLDLGNVRDVAQVRVNGKELEARPWAPYVWDVTEAVKAGANALEVRVQGPVANGAGGGGGGRGGRGATTGRGTTVPTAAPAAGAVSGLLGPVRVLAQ